VQGEIPPRTELGDVAFPVAFEVAKRLKQEKGERANPRAIAEELKAALERKRAWRASKWRARATSTFFMIARRACSTSSSRAEPPLSAV
jgi:arginyl-tRNA synthetase